MRSFRLATCSAVVYQALALLVASAPVAAEDWPAWRGTDGLAIWSEEGILEELPESGLEVRWRAEVKEGYAGPAVAGGRVFVADFERAGPRKLAGRERVVALDEETGEHLWTHAWEVSYAAIMGSYAEGPRAVPTVSGNRVYAVGAAGHLVCLDTETGKVVWQKHYPSDYDVGVPIFGFSSSILIRGDLAITIVGGEPDAMVVAFDKETGEERWRALETVSEPGYAQPTVVELAGREQLLVWHPVALAGLDPDTGEVLWEFAYEAKDTLSVANPVVSGNRLFVTQFYGGSLMLEIEKTADGFEAKELWRAKGESEMPGKTAALHSLITTPIFEGETVYGIDSYGELRALEAATGQRLWENKKMVRQGRWGTAFSVRQGDRWVAFTDEGDVVFYRLDREAYQELSRTRLLEPTTSAGFGPRRFADALVNWGHPAFANRHIVVRNDREVISASLAAE